MRSRIVRFFTSDRLLLILLPVVAAAMPLWDVLLHRLGVSPNLVHYGLAVGGAVVAFVVALLIIRLRESRSRLAREVAGDAAIIEAASGIDGSDHARAVLGKFAEQVCVMLEVERAVVFLRDGSDPDAVVAVAGYGVGDLVGRHFGADEGVFGQALATGQPVLLDEYSNQRSPVEHQATRGLHAGGAVPIRSAGKLVGAFSAGTLDPNRKFGERELRVLSQLADLCGVALEHATIREQLEVAVRAGVEALAAAVETRDSPTGKHSEEVVRLARRVGKRLGLEGDALTEVELVARLHDVGKLGVPDAILHKLGALDSEEWETMKKHPVWGAELLARIPGLEGMAKVVRAVHERWDGMGYPDGLEGTEIPLTSRIVFACDAYEAMVANRPYRPGIGHEAALRELRENAGSQFDPTVVEAAIEVLSAHIAAGFSASSRETAPIARC